MHNPNKNLYRSYSWTKDWKPEKLQYNVRMAEDAVPYTYVQWCDDNCKGNWSWHFDKDYGYISFDSAMDVVLFKLKTFKGI